MTPETLATVEECLRYSIALSLPSPPDEDGLTALIALASDDAAVALRELLPEKYARKVRVGDEVYNAYLTYLNNNGPAKVVHIEEDTVMVKYANSGAFGLWALSNCANVDTATASTEAN